MPDFEIIRARVKDDIVILIDRLMRAKQEEVVLVLPKNSIITANPDSLKLIKEEAESTGKILSLSTENDELKSFAKKLKIPIYNPNAAPRPKKIKRMMDILPPQDKLPLETIPTPPKTPIYEVSQKFDLETDLGNDLETYNNPELELEKNLEDFYNKPQNQDIKPKKNILKWLITFLIIIGSMSFLAAIYLSLPQADIRIFVKKIPLKINIPVTVSKNISSSNLISGIIPGQYFLLTQSGSKIIEEKQGLSPLKAGGFVNIYNAYSAAPQKLVAQTRLETKDGKIFRIQKSIIVPGAKMSGKNLTPSSIGAEVLADSFGEEYNIGPSYFTIPGFKGTLKYAGFYAKSAEPMTGKIVTASSLSKENLEKYKKELQNELAEELKNDTLATLKNSDLKLVDGASNIKIDEFKSTSQNLTMKITWQAIFFKESDIKTLINHFISSQNPSFKNFNFEDNIEYPKANRADFSKGELFLVLEINKDNAVVTDVNSLKKELAGLNENQMRTLISDKNFINSAVISLWPFWVKQAPNNPGKINVTLIQ